MRLFWWSNPKQPMWGGAMLFLSESHYFELTVGLGECSNNYAELMSLKLLLMFAAEKGCRSLNIFWDSMNTINWINKTQICTNIRLANILLYIKEILISFTTYSWWHVYRENNKEANKASKEGLKLDLWIWKIKKSRNGVVQDFFHRPFIH